MKKVFFDIFIILTSFLTVVFGVFSNAYVENGYELLWLHPLIYMLVYVMILRPTVSLKKYKITLFFFIALSWIRCVMVPFLSFVSETYNGVPYAVVSPDSAKLAILLVIYELFISSAFLYILIRFFSERESNRISKENSNLVLLGNKYIYMIFIFFATIIFLTIGRNLVEFFIISVESQERIGDLQGSFLVLLRQIITAGIIFSFLLVSNYCRKKYNITKNKIFFYVAIGFSLFSVGTIVGERRSVIVYTALVSIFILTKLFEKHKKEVIFYIAGVGAFVLLTMTIYKHFSAFYYGSYTDAISSSDNDISYYASMLQAYFFGTQNVAMAVELKQYSNVSLINLFYDFARSTFGLNFLLKEKMTMTSELFNTHIYGFSVPSGHVLSAAGYGYVYFGILLSPIIVCINITVSIILEKWFNKTISLELKYILGYMLLRFATNIFVATPPLINVATNMFFTVGLVYFAAVSIKKNKKTISVK